MLRQGYRNEKIAKLLKVHRNTISNWKNNRNYNKIKEKSSKLSHEDKILIKNNMYQNYNWAVQKTTKIIND